MAGDGLNGTDLQLGYHGHPVVHDASIEVRPGRVTALVGPNGSGKSTLLRALARLHKPDRGELRFGEGTSAFALSARDFARRVSFLSQSHPTPNGIGVSDVVGYGRYPYRGTWRSEDHEGARAVAWAMQVTGIEPLAGRCVDELSGGELQRVWLATCLAQDTGVLLLDEPTTFLDLRYQVEILDLVRDLADEHDVAVGIVLHDLDQAAAVADHVVLLEQGRIRAAGPPPEVLTAEHLSATYGINIVVSTDPVTGSLTTRAVGKRVFTSAL